MAIRVEPPAIQCAGKVVGSAIPLFFSDWTSAWRIWLELFFMGSTRMKRLCKPIWKHRTSKA
jgi:hypothetical protein